MRSSGSSLVTRLIISLAAALPGTAAFFATSARVSSDIDPLYVPFVWHLAQWAFKIGTTSWAKSTALGGSAARAGSPTSETTTDRNRDGEAMTESGAGGSC